MSIRTLNTDKVRELYQEKGIDIEVLMGSPLETVLTTGAITTFIFTRRSVTLPYIQQIINQQRLAIELESEDLFYTDISILNEIFCIVNINRQAEVAIIQSKNSKETREISIDALRYYLSHAIKEEIRTIEADFNSHSIKWAQSEEIQINEELENLSCTHPSRFYNQVHISIRQKKLGQLLHTKEQERKESRLRELISKLTGITFSDKELKK